MPSSARSPSSHLALITGAAERMKFHAPLRQFHPALAIFIYNPYGTLGLGQVWLNLVLPDLCRYLNHPHPSGVSGLTPGVLPLWQTRGRRENPYGSRSTCLSRQTPLLWFG